ncbi:MAG: PfkB family carbohydrate kinase [Chloroflexia bacterium]
MPTTQQPAPDYLVLGHVSKDLLAAGKTAAGGTVIYAGLTAQALGVRAAIVTALATPDLGLLDVARRAGVLCEVRPSHATTTFALEYHGEDRRLRLDARAAPLHPDDIPVAWRGAGILHLGPVAAELESGSSWASWPHGALLAVTPQGWLRTWDRDGLIHPAPWRNPGPLLARADVLVMSAEDTGYDLEALAGYVSQACLSAVTAGSEGADLYEHGRHIGHVHSLLAVPMDYTGAGDVFAAAFLIRYRETGDPMRAAAFAHSAAAFAIEAAGPAGIAPRPLVEARLAT